MPPLTEKEMKILESLWIRLYLLGTANIYQMHK